MPTVSLGHSASRIVAGGGSVVVNADGSVSITTPAVSAGIDSLTLTAGAHTTVIAEKSIFVVAAQTITITGDYATQRFIRVAQPIISAATAKTVTTAVTMDIASPTVAASGVITNTRALRVGASATMAGTAAGATYAALQIPAHTVTDAGTTTLTTTPAIAGLQVNQLTVATTGAGVNVGNVFGAHVAMPTIGTDVTADTMRVLFLEPGCTFNQSAAGATVGGLRLGSGTITLGNATGLTGSPGVFGISIGTITVSSATNPAVTNAAALYIAAAPVAGGTATISNAYAIWVDAGDTRLDGSLTISQAAVTGGATALSITPGAHGTVTAEVIDLSVVAHTMTITTAGYATQRFVNIAQPTISAASALTVTTAATMNIAAAPTVAASAVITNTYALQVGGAVSLAGATSSAYAAINIPAHTVTDTTTTEITANPSIAGLRVGQITVAQSGGAVSVGNVVGMSVDMPTLGTSVNAATVRGVLITGSSTWTPTSGGSTSYMLRMAGVTLTLAATTQITSTPGIAAVSIGQITVAQSGGAVTVDNVASLYIAAAPTPGASVTLTNTYALWVDAGNSRLDGSLTISQAAVAAGAVALTVTPGAHTALTAEVQDITLAAHSVTLTAGPTTITLARSVVLGATTYVGVAGGDTEAVTTAITLEVGLPVQGTNLTVTNAPIALRALGNVVIGNVLTPAAGPTNTLTIASGTAPTVNVADAAQIYVADANAAAGYAVPHMIAETNAKPLIIVGATIKTDTGRTANPYEGLMEINTSDNLVAVYADAGWRTIASGW